MLIWPISQYISGGEISLYICETEGESGLPLAREPSLLITKTEDKGEPQPASNEASQESHQGAEVEEITEELRGGRNKGAQIIKGGKEEREKGG